MVEFQPWIYYSLIRSRLERDSCSLERETCIELILNSICSRLGRVKGLWVHRVVLFSVLRIDRRKVRKKSGVWSIDLRLLIKRYWRIDGLTYWVSANWKGKSLNIWDSIVREYVKMLVCSLWIKWIIANSTGTIVDKLRILNLCSETRDDIH